MLHWLSLLVHVIIWGYAMLQLFNENVIFYQEKLFMLFNGQTTYWTFISKNWTPK